jgi:cell division protein FtsQ
MKRLLKILLLLPVVYIVTIPVYYARTAYSRPCRGIRISIADSSDYHFVTKRDIQNTINGTTGGILGKPVKEIAVDQIEAGMNEKYRELKVAEVYTTIDGTLHVYADQRNPIMRVMPGSGGDYYIDVEGVVVRRRNLYTPRLHIVGGNIIINQAMLNGISILDTSIKNSILKDIYHLVRYINGDNFWSAQVDQIYVDRNDEIDIIPRVGNHIVHLGTSENFEGKLKNLGVFYDKVLPEVGWNKYSTINLAFKDQIVCRRR